MIDPDADQIAVPDDAGSSPQTIPKRSQVGAASGHGDENDQQDHAINRPAPFARSSFLPENQHLLANKRAALAGDKALAESHCLHIVSNFGRSVAKVR